MFRLALGSTQQPIQWHLCLFLLKFEAAGIVKPTANLHLMSRIRIQGVILSLPTTPVWDGTKISLEIGLNLHKIKEVKIVWFSNVGNVKVPLMLSKLERRCNCAIFQHEVQVRKDWIAIQAIWVNISIIDINPSLAQQSKIEKEEEEAVVFDLRCFTSPIHRDGLWSTSVLIWSISTVKFSKHGILWSSIIYSVSQKVSTQWNSDLSTSYKPEISQYVIVQICTRTLHTQIPSMFKFSSIWYSTYSTDFLQ